MCAFRRRAGKIHIPGFPGTALAFFLCIVLGVHGVLAFLRFGAGVLVLKTPENPQKNPV